MTNRFVTSRLIQKNIRFKVQIGDCSKYVCKGYYTSPEFGEDQCKWSLLVHVYDGADYENFIEVRLRRHDCLSEQTIVQTKISIVNCLGFKEFENERKMLFMDDARILAVAKEDFKGWRKWFYLPKDTLTLHCDVVVHESSVTAHKNKNGIFNSIFHNKKNFLECFTHSRLVETAKDDFNRRIQDFSLHAYTGRIVTPEYESEHLGGKWSLVVCCTSEDDLTNNLDIRVMREEICEPQIIKVRLSIIGSSKKPLHTKEKYIYFTSSREMQVITLTDNDTSSWFGMIKKQITPDDTLTLHCEMILYQEIDESFRKKEEFEKSVKITGYSSLQFIPYFFALLFMLLVVVHIFYLLCCFIFAFTWHILLFTYETAKLFIFRVIVICLILIWIKNTAEKILHRKKVREMKKKLRENRDDIVFVPVSAKTMISQGDYYMKIGKIYSRKPEYYYHTKKDFNRFKKSKYYYK